MDTVKEVKQLHDHVCFISFIGCGRGARPIGWIETVCAIEVQRVCGEFRWVDWSAHGGLQIVLLFQLAEVVEPWKSQFNSKAIRKLCLDNGTKLQQLYR